MAEHNGGGVLRLECFRETLVELMAGDALLVLGHGLGLRQLLTAMVQAYCDPNFLVLLLNVPSDEETRLVADLALADVRHLPKIVNNEVGIKERGEMYLEGGVLSITSRILVVDMLARRFPTENVDLIIVNHAERVTETSQETFILSLFRQHNRKGLIRAFSDQPEEFAAGFDKLARTMRLLYVKKIHLRPRFYISVRDSLAAHPLDTVELCVAWPIPVVLLNLRTGLTRCQPMTDHMFTIQKALIELLDNCLFELRQANPQADVTEFTVANAIFRSFDKTLQASLDPIWYKVSARSKQLVSDLKTIRKLLTMLTTYDCIHFFKMFEILLTGLHAIGQHSTWLLLDAANTVYKHAQARVFRFRDGNGKGQAEQRRRITSDDIEPVLEHNPKWTILSEILTEIEAAEKETGHDDYSVLVICEEERECAQVRDYVALGGDAYLQRELKKYLKWKENLPRFTANISTANKYGNRSLASSASASSGPATASTGRGGGNIAKRRRGAIAAGLPRKASSALTGGPGNLAAESEALADFLSWFPDDPKERNTMFAKVRQAATATLSTVGSTRDSGSSSSDIKGKRKAVVAPTDDDDIDDVELAEILAQQDQESSEMPAQEIGRDNGDQDAAIDAEQFNQHFGLLTAPRIIISSAAHVLQENVMFEMRPKYIVLYDPSLELLRTAEIYRACNPGQPVRCYFTFYDESVEEQRYLKTIQRELGAFEHLIKEKASMAVREDQDARHDTFWEARQNEQLTTTRIGGGMIVVPKKSKVVVDMREFRSSLPLLLFQQGMQISPVTLEVGDYILSPEMCVERKSLNDLISSLASGRLYYQAEAMCKYYVYAILLIEFEQNKQFALQAVYDIKDDISPLAVSSKLALLCTHFPRLRIIWSTSPFQTAEIFEQLKNNSAEPDEQTAAEIGADSDAINSDYNVVPQELLQNLPGVTGYNHRMLMRKVYCLKDLASLSLKQLEEWLTAKPATELYKFLHKDQRR